MYHMHYAHALVNFTFKDDSISVYCKFHAFCQITAQTGTNSDCTVLGETSLPDPFWTLGRLVSQSLARLVFTKPFWNLED